jgi:hypothetical protein
MTISNYKKSDEARYSELHDLMNEDNESLRDEEYEKKC